MNNMQTVKQHSCRGLCSSSFCSHAYIFWNKNQSTDPRSGLWAAMVFGCKEWEKLLVLGYISGSCSLIPQNNKSNTFEYN